MFSRCTFVQEFPISPRMLLSPGRGRSPERLTFTAVELHSAGWHHRRGIAPKSDSFAPILESYSLL